MKPFGLLLFCQLTQVSAALGGFVASELMGGWMDAPLSPLPSGSDLSSVHGIELSVLAQWAFIWHFGVK